MNNEKDLLNDIENDVENVISLESKDPKNKRQKKSDVLLYFPISEEEETNSTSIVTNLLTYINTKKLTQEDLLDYYKSRTPDDLTKASMASYNMLSTLNERRDFRISTLETLCDFLNVDVVLVDKPEINIDGEETSRD